MSSDSSSTLRLALAAMGTRFELVLGGAAEIELRAIGEAALDEIERADRRLSAFRSDSLISYLNREAFRRACPVDGELIALLSSCRDIWRQSGAAFDITVGPLMHHWGFRGDAPGAAEALAGVRAEVGFEHVEIDEGRSSVRFHRPGLQLDLGAVGKGYAIDRALEILREHGIESALIHGGTSSIGALGAPLGRSAWEIALADPGAAGSQLGRVQLRDACLGVSAPHGRSVAAGARCAGHILDPRSGRPARGGSVAAVLADGAAAADAWSTALLVLALEPGLEESVLPGTISALVLTDTIEVHGPRAHAFELGGRSQSNPKKTLQENG